MQGWPLPALSCRRRHQLGHAFLQQFPQGTHLARKSQLPQGLALYVTHALLGYAQARGYLPDRVLTPVFQAEPAADHVGLTLAEGGEHATHVAAQRVANGIVQG